MLVGLLEESMQASTIVAEETKACGCAPVQPARKCRYALPLVMLALLLPAARSLSAGAPSFTVGPDQNVLENDAPQTVAGWATNISPALNVFFIVSSDNNALFAPGFQPTITLNGTLTYAPATDASGIATVTVVLQDNGSPPAQSPPQTFTITVGLVNHPPFFTKGVDINVFENKGTQVFKNWATNILPHPWPEGNYKNEDQQKVTFALSNDNNALFTSDGQPKLGSDGTLLFTPAPDQWGTATVTVVLHDDGGTANGGQDTWATNDKWVSRPGTGAISSGYRVTGNGTAFTTTVLPGYTILALGQTQVVAQVIDDVTLITQGAFNPPLPSGTTYSICVLGQGTISSNVFTVVGVGTRFMADFFVGNATSIVAAGQNQGVSWWNVLDDVTLWTNGIFSPALPPGTPYLIGTPGPGTVASGNDVVGVGTLFLSEVQPGDTIQAAGQSQLVSQVIDDLNLLTIAPFNPPLLPGMLYVIQSPLAGTISSVGNDVIGVGTRFLSQVVAGDTIMALGQAQVVALVIDDFNLVTVAPFAPPLPAGTPYSVGFLGQGTISNPPAPPNTDLAVTGSMAGPEPGTISSAGTTVTGSGTNFISQLRLRPGDVIVTVATLTQPSQTLTVAAVQSDTKLTTTIAAAPALVAGTTFSIVETKFMSQLQSGDTIRAAGQTQIVSQVTDDLNFVTANPFAPPLPAGTPYFIQKTFTINILFVNQPPTFTKGPDITMPRNSGAVTIGGWATNMLAGPANEYAPPPPPPLVPQAVNFIITGNTNPGLFTATGQPAVALDGTLTFTPLDYATPGIATISVVARDDGGTANGGKDTSQPQTFNINITFALRTNVAPRANNQTVSAFENTPKVITLTGIDNNVQTGGRIALSYSIVTPPQHGTLSAITQPTAAPWTKATVTYTPDPYYFDPVNPDSFTFTVTNSDTVYPPLFQPPSLTSLPGTVTISVSHVNQAPSFTLLASTVTVLENSAPYSGTLAANISPAPVAAPANYQSGLTVHFSIGSNSSPALFTVQPTLDPTGVLTFTPAANMAGSADLVVTLKNNGGKSNGGQDTSAPQQFTIQVQYVNQPPVVADPGQQFGLQNHPDIVPLDGIYPGPAVATWEFGQQVSLSVTSNPAFPVLTLTPLQSENNPPDPFWPATATINYTPPTDFVGNAEITVTAKDDGGMANGGNDTANLTFLLDIQLINRPPTFTPGGDVSVPEGSGPYSAAWATNVSPGPNPPAAGVTVKQFNVSNNNSSLFTVQPAIDTSGVLTFTPADHVLGTATVTVTLQNSGGTAHGGVDTSAPQTFTVTVTPFNSPPNASSAGAAVQAYEGQSVIITLSGDDGNPELDQLGQFQRLTFSIASQPAHGTLTALTQPTASPWNTATVVYTADPLQLGNPLADTFTFNVTDDGGGCPNGPLTSTTAGTVSITVNPVNYPPSFTLGQNLALPENSGAQVYSNWVTNILNCTPPPTALPGPYPDEAGQNVSFTITKIDTTPIGSTTPTTPAYALFSAISIDGAGTLSFTPAPNTSGTATITVLATDDGSTTGPYDNNTSPPQTFTITLAQVNNPPIANPQSGTTNRNTTMVITLTGDDQDVPEDQKLTFAITSLPVHGTLSAVTQPAASPWSSATVLYTANVGYSGADSFSFTVTDDGQAGQPADLTSAPATVSITITSNPTLPQALAQSQQVAEGSPLNITLSGTDTDLPPPTLTYDIATPPAHGTLTGFDTNTGAVTYTSGLYNGTDSFTFTVTAHTPGFADVTSPPATVSITVTPVNFAPTALPQTVSTTENAPVVITLAGRSGNPEDTQVLAFAVVTPPAHGTLSAITQPAAAPWNRATVTYTPNIYYFGPDSFTFTVTDDANGGPPPNLTSAPATVTLNVAFANQPPVTTPLTVVTGMNLPVAITLGAFDPQNMAVQFAVASQPANGTLTGTAPALTYTPKIGYVGGDSFTFTATNTVNLTSAPGVVSITVTPPPSFESPPTVTPTAIVAGQSVTVQANAGPAAITWDFGDGTQASGGSATHVYAQPGIYTITVTATSAEGATSIFQLQVFVGLSTVGGTGVQPGLAILVGGPGLGKKAGASAKLAANYLRRDKTSFSASVGSIDFPSTLQYSQLAGQPGIFTVGQGPLAQTFVFTMDQKGRFKATSLPGQQLDLKKKTLRVTFNNRPGLTDLFESMGGWVRGVKKGQVQIWDVPVTLQVGNVVYLALTFRLQYQQVGNAGKGALAK